MHQNAEAIADAIVALINSRPKTPARREIAAVISFELRRAQLQAAQDARQTYASSAWRCSLGTYMDEIEKPGMAEEHLRALDQQLLDVATSTFATRVLKITQGRA